MRLGKSPRMQTGSPTAIMKILLPMIRSLRWFIHAKPSMSDGTFTTPNPTKSSQVKPKRKRHSKWERITSTSGSIRFIHTRGPDFISFMANPYGVKLIQIAQGNLWFTDAERRDRCNIAAKIVENGWVVEMEIPWEILDYPETTEPIRMGINFERVHARTRTASVWSNVGFPLYRSKDDGHWLHVLPPPKWPDTQIPRVISNTKPHEHLHQKGETP